MGDGSRSDSQSTPCVASPAEMLARNKKRKSRTSHLVASTRITQWFKNVGMSPVEQAAPKPPTSSASAVPKPDSKKILYWSPKPPVPAREPTEASDSRRPPTNKKKIRGRKLKSAIQEQRPSTSVPAVSPSLSLLFLLLLLQNLPCKKRRPSRASQLFMSSVAAKFLVRNARPLPSQTCRKEEMDPHNKM